jgi:hypothetical protein
MPGMSERERRIREDRANVKWHDCGHGKDGQG